LLNSDFHWIGGKAYSVLWEAIEKCGLDIPDIAFLYARLLFDVSRHSGFNDLHVRRSLLKSSAPFFADHPDAMPKLARLYPLLPYSCRRVAIAFRYLRRLE
jgi:hypothetical protein